MISAPARGGVSPSTLPKINAQPGKGRGKQWQLPFTFAIEDRPPAESCFRWISRTVYGRLDRSTEITRKDHQVISDAYRTILCSRAGAGWRCVSSRHSSEVK